MAATSVFMSTSVARLTTTPSSSTRNINFAVVRCMSQDQQPSTKTPATPTTPPPPPAPKVSTKFSDVLAFGGPAPERINGRLAMIGFVSAMAVELSNGQDVFAQISHGGVPAFVATSLVLSVASLVPLFKGQQKVVSMGKRTNTDTAAFQAFMKKDGAAGTQNRNTSKNSKKTADDKVEHCVFCGKDGHNRAMATTVSEILWLRWLLKELGAEQNIATQLFCDNLAVKHIANNPAFHERTKHVEMDCYFVRERVESNDVEPLYVDTKSQVADLFTKPLGSRQLQLLLGKLGICDPHAPT
uniref:Putative chlorophyll A-B binding protein n=1 Tax=Helianthus annuus TaxID=4232 RepID=A0A251V9N3_HELAN